MTKIPYLQKLLSFLYELNKKIKVHSNLNASYIFHRRKYAKREMWPLEQTGRRMCTKFMRLCGRFVQFKQFLILNTQKESPSILIVKILRKFQKKSK